MEYALNSAHVQEVKKYVNFFEQKRRESLSEINTSFQQFFANKIKDEILSKAEVETLINDLHQEIKTTIDSELQNIVYMSGVYIKILMSQAESSNLVLQGDVSFIENEKAIEEMKNLGNFERDLIKKTQGGRLPSLQAGIITEQSMAVKLKEITDERDSLKRKNLELQANITELLEEIHKNRAVSESLTARNENNYEIEVKEVSQALEETKVRVS